MGITARVFGDLRALATTEARLVLGAAVADDVMGLVVLTVVVRLVTEGSVSVLSVLWIVIVAVAFLVIGGFVGLKVAGPLFAFVDRFSRSTGTLVAIAFAFALGFARLAEAAQLAPIVGAFVAGIALSKASAAPRISRELAPVGHLFIPVFFLGIGIDADVERLLLGAVLRDAGILLVVATVGKLVSPVGAIGTRGDKTLIGLGMLPRGEVGLIFATIGLQNGILGDDLYAALLLVVLATTLITPPLLKFRYGRLRAAAVPTGPPPDTEPPDGGWLVVTDGEIDLAADPPLVRGLAIGLRAAIIAGRHGPTQHLLDWLTALPDEAVVWDDDGREAFLDLVERGNARSWRLLSPPASSAAPSRNWSWRCAIARRIRSPWTPARPTGSPPSSACAPSTSTSPWPSSSAKWRTSTWSWSRSSRSMPPTGPRTEAMSLKPQPDTSGSTPPASAASERWRRMATGFCGAPPTGPRGSPKPPCSRWPPTSVRRSRRGPSTC